MSPRVAAALALVLCYLVGGGGGTREARASLAPASTATAAPTGLAPSASLGGPVASGASDPEDIHDIHGPIAVPGRRPLWWLVAGAGLLAVTAAGLVLFARRRPRRSSPHQRALQALVELRASPGSDARTFCFAVSEIVRLYVEEALGVRAAHRTTEEVLVDLMVDESPLAPHRTAVGEFLRHCDLAKFGGWSLSEAELAALLTSAETFVLATAPTPPHAQIRVAVLPREGVA